MRGVFLMPPVFGLLFIYGCAKNDPPEPQQTQGIEIHAPGIDVKIDKSEGLEVKAPGTEVRANKERGVDVKAPGVEVEAQPRKTHRDSESP